MESKFIYMTIELREKYNGIEWDIMQRYAIDDTHGETKYYIFNTQLSYMTKRKIIKRLVKMGGIRSKRYGCLVVNFYSGQEKEVIEWIDSLRLIDKLKS